jgi:hypothetical protein
VASDASKILLAGMRFAALDAVGCVAHALRRAAARNASSVMMAFMFEA